jgi:hypothetical protein
MPISYINILAASIFSILCIIVTLSLFYIYRNKKNLHNNKENMEQNYYSSANHNESNQEQVPMNVDKLIQNALTYDKKNGTIRVSINRERKNDPKMIEQDERVNFISKCNYVDKALESLLSKQMVMYNRQQKHILMEKQIYIKKIRDIVNDLAFTNKKEFEQLYNVLKEIQKDVTNQNQRITDLEKKVSTEDKSKNELTNMLIQRIINDSSKQSLRKSNLEELLKTAGDDKEDELKLLEKYIVKTIRKQMSKDIKTHPIQTQSMDPVINMELKRKVELMDIMNNKLHSMENLYKNIHSNNKKQIISVIKTPVKQAIRSYLPVVNKKKCTKNLDKDIKVVRKEGEANAFYVTN